MFNCNNCGNTSKPRESAVRVITKKRYKEYPLREKIFVKFIEGKKVLVDDPGGVGFEAESEALFCKLCASLHVQPVANTQPVAS